MMDLDELERIATEAQRNTLTGVWEFKRDCSPEDVLALVRVAKAAQEWLDHGPGQGHCEEEDCPCTSTVCQLKKATVALSPDVKESTAPEPFRCVKSSCGRRYARQPGSCLSCGSDVYETR